MSIWYSDPQPTQRINRLPASAFTTGSQPPRMAVAGAIAMACVLASTPSLGEPVPLQPMQGRSQIVPLTFTYGQQPPIKGALAPAQTVVARISWPEDSEPRLQFNNQAVGTDYIVVQTFVYGQQPPVRGALTPTQGSIARYSWPEDREPRLQFNNQQVGTDYVVPLTFKYGSQPIPWLVTPGQMSVLRSSWPEDREPRLWLPQIGANYIAAQTFTYGQQPRPTGALPQIHNIVRAWLEPSLYPESGPNSASWNVPVAVQTYLAPNKYPWWVAAERPRILLQLSLTGFIRPTVTTPFVPPSESPWWIGVAWREPFPDIQYSGAFIPATAGDQPPIAGTLRVARAQIIGTLAPWWPAQSEADSAGWNVPVVASSPFIPRATGVPLSVIITWNRLDNVSQIRRWVVQARAQSDALRGKISLDPRLDGLATIVVRLDGTVTIGPRLTGIVITGPLDI